MDVERFIITVGRLSVGEMAAIATAIDASAASAAGEVAWWHATVEIERLLRQRRCSREATLAAHRAAEAVLASAREQGIALPDTQVTCVARAAADVARGLVAGGVAQVDELTRTWPVLVAA